MCLGLANDYRKPITEKERTYAELKGTHFPEKNSGTELTRDDILKALECCILSDCENCPYCKEKACTERLNRKIISLINRQQAEIERLNIELKAMRGAANYYKAENERLQKEE